eukprot:TRINITY_DN810_c1_g1_i1.p1 TRINITY_DN810_c1_g1~~TRINITY_DN810_c1_g1_i1.p1  ORF type:complete len:363 (-),score=175.23 TRINITY_DN810_c1_g1_i1:73-1161(-)
MVATTDIQFVDREQSNAVLADVRNDNTETDWALWAYQEPSANILELRGSGTGGLEELKQHLTPPDRMYGFFRVVDVIDNHPTVKFVFFAWAGEKVSVVKKARMTTHKGSITEFIGQTHLSIDASDFDDIALDKIMSRVGDASGSGSRVLAAHASSSASSSSAPAPVAVAVARSVEDAPLERAVAAEPAQVQAPAARAASAPSGKVSFTRSAIPKGGSTLSFENADELQQAIRRVRSDADPADWVLFGYRGNENVIVLNGVGEGSLDALSAQLKLDTVNYGILRVTDEIDSHITVKFVLIIWIGESVKIMRKALIATHKGAITEFIGQYHTDVNASNFSELTIEEVIRKVKDASGTAVHVKNI